jgi:osomolarity two-component system response regulator SSK1
VISGSAGSNNTTAAASDQRGGDQSQAGSDRRAVVLSSTPPRESNDGNLDDDDHDDGGKHERQEQRRRQQQSPPPQEEEVEDDTYSNQSERRSSTSLFRHGSTRSSRFFNSSSRNPLPSPGLDHDLDPASPSFAQSPERYRITRSVLEEYEAEQEVRPDSISRQLPSRGPSLANNRDSSYTSSQSKPPGLTRKQSILPQQSQALIRSLLGSGDAATPSEEPNPNYQAFDDDALNPSMVSRKIWVKRPGASATLVTVVEDHLVDDVRDMILRKYANTLGRSFDSPDVTLRVIPRENRQERTLGPEEPICQVLDGFFPGGQTVDEALVIDVPLRRTPRPSPQPVPMGRYYPEEERRPPEAASEYFPPMPVPTVPSPHLPGMMPFSARVRDRSPSSISLAFNVGLNDRPRS